MDDFHRLPAITAFLILAITLASGPVVGLDLVADPADEGYDGNGDPGSGTLNATVADVPTSADLERSRFGADVYRLSVPPAKVTVEEVTGRPLITYKIRIEALGHESGSATVLDPSHGGRRTLSIQEATFDPDEVRRDEYEGELIVLQRDDAGKTVLSRTNVTVAVER